MKGVGGGNSIRPTVFVFPYKSILLPIVGAASKLDAGIDAGGKVPALAFCCPPKIPLRMPLPVG